MVYVQHSAQKYLVLGSHDWKLHPKLSPLPEELRVEKLQGNAFEGTPLVEELEACQVGRVVVCGLVTQGCVKATTLGALELGYQVVLAGDTHSSYSKDAAEADRAVEWEAGGGGRRFKRLLRLSSDDRWGGQQCYDMSLRAERSSILAGQEIASGRKRTSLRNDSWILINEGRGRLWVLAMTRSVMK